FYTIQRESSGIFMMDSQIDTEKNSYKPILSNKQVIITFIAGLLMLLIAFGAGLSIIKSSLTTDTNPDAVKTAKPNRNPKPLHKRQLRKPIIVYRAQSHLWLRSTPSSFRFTAQKKQRNAPEPNSAVRITGAPIFRSRRDRIRSIRSISVLM